MDVNRKPHPDCPYSANPFHECASDCLEKISLGHGKKQVSKFPSLPGSLGKKKRQTHPPLNTRHYQNVPTISPKPEMPLRKIPLYSNYMLDIFQGDHSKTVSPRPREQKHSDKNNTASEISVFNVVSSSRSNTNDDDDDEDGIELNLTSVRRYHVNSDVFTILQSVIDKHGDIAENCTLESASLRSRYLEGLCSLIQELGTTPVGQLTELKVKEMLEVLEDLESVNIDVSWVSSVLEEFAKYQENTEKEKQGGLVRLKKEEMEIQETDLARIEKEVVEVRSRVEEMKAELTEMEKYKGKSFLDELL